MDFYAVLILECMLFVHASCQPIGNAERAGVLKTINMTLENVGIMLSSLTVRGLLLEKPCNTSNMVELLGPEQQPLVAHHFSTFRCYMEKFSELTEGLHDLPSTAQFMKSVEVKLSGATISKNCSLPAFEEEADCYFEAKCFLEIMRKRLHSFQF